MPDETQKLIMQVVNADKVRDLTRQLDEQEEKLKSLAVQLRETAISQGMFDAAAKAPAAKVVALSREIKSLEAQTRSYSQAALTASHATQDFVQGGVGGVLNNIPMLVTQLGGPAGLAAAISGIGIAAYVATPLLKGMWKSFTDDGNSVPLKGLAEMAKRLEEVKTSVEAIKTADVWNLETIQQYNQALESQASIEKDIAERKKHRNDYEAFMAAPSESDKGRSDELRKDFQKEFAGDGPELQAELMKGLEAAAEFERDQIRRELAGLQAGLRRSQGLGDSRGASSRKAAIKALESRLAGIGAGINARVTGLISEAAGGVDAVKQENALEAMQQIVSPATGERLGRVVSGLDPTGGQSVESAEERAERLKADREKAAAKKARRAAQEEEVRQAGQSTAEELRQSEALDYLDKFAKRNAPGLKLDNKDQVAISEDMLKARDAGLSAKDATAKAVRDFMDKRRGVQDDSLKMQLESEFARFAGDRGFSLNARQIAEAAQSIFGAMQNQVGKDDAAIMALRELVQANAELSGQMAAQKAMLGQVRENARITRSRMSRR